MNIKCDCPIALHTWLLNWVDAFLSSSPNGILTTYRLGRLIFPIGANVTSSVYSTKKGQFKRQILKNVFYKKTLRECALFLNDKFCKPVSNLFTAIFKKNKTFTKAQCAQLLNLYGNYESLDTSYPDVACNMQYHYQSTKDVVHKFLADYYFQFTTYDSDTQAWLTQLIRNYEYPYGENAGIGQYNIELTLFLNNLIFKMKNEGPIQDSFLMNLLNVIVDEWYKKDTEILLPGEKYIISYHLDFPSFYTAMQQVIPQGGRGSPALY